MSKVSELSEVIEVSCIICDDISKRCDFFTINEQIDLCDKCLKKEHKKYLMQPLKLVERRLFNTLCLKKELNEIRKKGIF